MCVVNHIIIGCVIYTAPTQKCCWGKKKKKKWPELFDMKLTKNWADWIELFTETRHRKSCSNWTPIVMNQSETSIPNHNMIRRRNRLLFYFTRSFENMKQILERFCDTTTTSENSWAMWLRLRRCYYNPWFMTQWSIKWSGNSLSIGSYLGSGGPSDSGFIDSLQRERKTRKASFWRMWENFAPGGWPGATPDSFASTKDRN